MRSDGVKRIVLLANGQDRYDIRYPSLAIVVRVSRSNISRLDWLGAAPTDVDGDGLLIVRDAGDRKSGLVLFLSHGRLVTATPADYQTLSPQ